MACVKGVYSKVFSLRALRLKLFANNKLGACTIFDPNGIQIHLPWAQNFLYTAVAGKGVKSVRGIFLSSEGRTTFF